MRTRIIPVECVPPAGVAVCWVVSASMHAGIPPWVWAQVWAWKHSQCGLGDPLRPDPSTSPLGVGLETCKACWDTTCNACWDTPPLWTEFLTHASENITLPQTSFAGGNDLLGWIQEEPTPKGRARTYHSTKFPWKLYENEENWTERGRIQNFTM